MSYSSNQHFREIGLAAKWLESLRHFMAVFNTGLEETQNPWKWCANPWKQHKTNMGFLTKSIFYRHNSLRSKFFGTYRHRWKNTHTSFRGICILYGFCLCPIYQLNSSGFANLQVTHQDHLSEHRIDRGASFVPNSRSARQRTQGSDLWED